MATQNDNNEKGYLVSEITVLQKQKRVALHIKIY